MSVQDYLSISPKQILSPVEANSTNQRVLLRKEINVTEYNNGASDEPIVVLTADFHRAKETVRHGHYDNYALLVRRHLIKQGNDWTRRWSRLEIQDPTIRDAIRIILRHNKDINLKANVITLAEPYRHLFWYRNDFNYYRNQLHSGQIEEQEGLALLDKFIQIHLKKPIEVYEQAVDHGLITFDYLWTIFRPNSILVAITGGVEQAFRAGTLKEVADGGEVIACELTCYSWGYVDGWFGLYKSKFRIDKFVGARRICDLAIFPIKYFPEAKRNTLIQDLIENGHRWRDLIRRQQKSYSAIAWQIERSNNTRVGESSLYHSFDMSSFTRTQIFVDGRIIIDEDMFRKENPGYIKPLEPWALKVYSAEGIPDADDGESDHQLSPDADFTEQDRRELFHQYNSADYNMTEAQALLCPQTVRGFSLQDHSWAEFSVKNVQPIAWDPESFQKIQINAIHRRMLKNLILNHGLNDNKFKDIVIGKGKGLTILLHGEPGSGKTLTAETISEYSRKPLLCVTSGQLGTNARTAEIKLKEYFRLAEAWKAILLMDEADVFLAKRTEKDIERNAFVSVFLRSMEYYGGIMILTTNRKEDFDAAFQSRIHLQLLYHPPDAQSRAAIWKNVLSAQNAATSFGESDFVRLGKAYCLNGRQLKNLILIALALARSEGKDINDEIIRAVFDANNSDDI